MTLQVPWLHFSAGALERMPVASDQYISTTEELQTQGVWVAAVDMDGESYYETEGDERRYSSDRKFSGARKRTKTRQPSCHGI